VSYLASIGLNCIPLILRNQSMQIVIDDLHRQPQKECRSQLFPFEFRHTSFWNAIVLGPGMGLNSIPGRKDCEERRFCLPCFRNGHPPYTLFIYLCRFRAYDRPCPWTQSPSYFTWHINDYEVSGVLNPMVVPWCGNHTVTIKSVKFDWLIR